MPKRATKTTFAYEPVGLTPGDNTEVRRQIVAGQFVPDHWRPENEADLSEEDIPYVGLGAAPQSYKHQLGDGATVPKKTAATKAST
jgi:hypothetical protein